MKAIEFPQQTHILAKDQPEYEPLPVHIAAGEPGTPFTCVFELSDEEIAQIVQTKRLYYTQLTCGNLFQPVRLSTMNPFD